MALRNEARSANHFKEVSYKLENKIVELTQTITTLKNENRSQSERMGQLEAQIRTWVEKYEKLEKKSKNLEAELAKPTVPQEEYDALQKEKDELAAEYRASKDRIKSHEATITQLTEQLKAEKEDKERLLKTIEEMKQHVRDEAEETELAELRSQNAAMKAQLSQVLHTPRRQQSVSAKGRSLSPLPHPADDIRNLSPSPIRHPSTELLPLKESTTSTSAAAPRTPSPTAAPLSRKGRRNSTAAVPESRPKTSIDNLRQAELLTRTPRPTSIHQFGPMFAGGKAGDLAESLGENPEEEVITKRADKKSKN